MNKRKLASTALRAFRRLGDKAGEGPTPERLLQANGTARVEVFGEAVEIFKRGRPEAKIIERQRIRIEDSPLDRLRARRLLAPEDGALNGVLYAAGMRYRELWMFSGLEPLRAIDMAREAGSGGIPGLFSSERQATAFAQYRMASDKMALHPRQVVDAVALHETEMVDIGRKLSGYQDARQAGAVATYLLRAGLTTLATHFGLLEGGG